MRIIKKSKAMKILLFTAVMFVAFSTMGQHPKVYNNPNAKTRSLAGAFTKISVSSGVELYLTQGNETALAISVSDNKYEERFKTEVVDGVLKIYYDNKGISWTNEKNRKLKAWVSYKTLDAIKASAGSNVVLTNPLNADVLAISCSSGAMLSGQLKASVLSADLNSGAQISASGSAGKLTVSAGSGAIFKGQNLLTEYCTASANSGAVIKIEVQKEINASANSGGVVHYKGNALLIKGNINSGGSVKQGS